MEDYSQLCVDRYGEVKQLTWESTCHPTQSPVSELVLDGNAEWDPAGRRHARNEDHSCLPPDH